MDRERVNAGSVQSAIQRVGRNNIDSDAMETQALASLAQGQPASEPAAPPGEDPRAPSTVESIVQILDAAQANAPK